MKVLVPVDGSEVAQLAVRHAVRLAGQGVDIHVHLLNVQAALSADVARFIARDVIEEYHDEQGAAALQPAIELLERAGLRHDSRVAVGNAAQAIVDEAASAGCDSIIMGTRGSGAVAGILLGSTATKVVHLASVPVTLVR